jgi:hypothetical protein
MSGRQEGDFRVNGNLHVGGSVTSQPRSFLLQDDLAVYPIPWTHWRVWDALHTNLPGTAANDDLALVGGTFGTDTPSIQTGDVKTLGSTTRRARCLMPLPVEYVAGQTVLLRFMAGLLTTLSDGAATLDVEAFLADREAGVSGSDLYSSSAVDIKSLTLANKDFSLDPSGLSPGDLLDIRVSIAITDAASATAVIGILAAAELLCDIKG